MARRIRVRGVRREPLDEDKLALALWLMGKAAVEEKRRREAEEKKRQRPNKPGVSDGR
jgi:hypothetical protein